MRIVRIPRSRTVRNHGLSVVVPVIVDWPELQLTADQVLTNAVARMRGEEPPFEDRSVFAIEITEDEGLERTDV